MSHCAFNHLSFLLIILHLINLCTQSFITFTSEAILSSETQALLVNYPMTTIGNNVTERIQSDLYSVDTNVNFPVKMLSRNGDTSVGIQELDSVMFNGITLQKDQYRINYTLLGKTYSSVPMEHYESSISNSDYLFECNYRVYFPSYTVFQNKTVLMFKKINFFSRAIFGLNNNDSKIYLISNYTNKTNNTELNKVLTQGSTDKGIKSEFKDFNIIIDKAVAKAYLLTIDTENTFCLSEIIFSTKRLYRSQVAVNTLSCRVMSELGEEFYSASVCGSSIYMTSTKKGIQIFKTKTLEYVNTVKETEGKDIISLDVVSNFIYAIEKGVGMLLFQTIGTSFQYRKTIEHPKMKSVDFYVNPFYGYRFVGVLLDRSEYVGSVEDRTKPNEFFIEFYFPKDNMMSPKVNKIFTHERNHIEEYISYDNFYFYFNNGHFNEVLIIRKGMLNAIPAISYLLVLPVVSLNSPMIVPIYNTTDNTFLPALYVDNDITFPYNLRFINHYMYCNVTKEGPYSLIFHQLTDACEASILSTLQERNCLKMVYYNLNILARFDDDTNTTIGIIVLVVVVIILVIIGIWIFKYTKGMKENRLKLIRIDKNDRRKLYLEKEENDFFLSEVQTKPTMNSNPIETENPLKGEEEDRKEEEIDTRIITRRNGRKKLKPINKEDNPNNVLVLHVQRKTLNPESNENIAKSISIKQDSNQIDNN